MRQYELVERVRRYNPDTDEALLDRAYVYAMGQEPWLGYVTSIKYTDESKPIVESNKLVEMCRSRGLQTERLLGTKELLL